MSSAGEVLALVPVRDGRLSPGGAEAVALAGRGWLVGSGAAEAVDGLIGATSAEVRVSQVDGFEPGGLAEAMAPLVAGDPRLVLPGSADGRDLAPHLAHVLGRPLVSGAIDLSARSATIVTHGGRLERDVVLDRPAVVTLQPGAFHFEPDHDTPPPSTEVVLEPAPADGITIEASLPPDPATMDLADAERIVAGGAGLGGPEAMNLLGRIGIALGASLGATRVVTDAGWTEPERQIGTTGVEVGPQLYLAFGISGAVQHVMGLGQPDYVVSVNVDPSCPMMAMADLAVVCDAQALLPALADRLGIDPAEPVT